MLLLCPIMAAILKENDTKFGMNIFVYPTHTALPSNIECHAQEDLVVGNC